MFEIFRSGERISADGSRWNITDADVQRAAEVYDPKLHEAPIVIGHPAMNAPAYGWVPKLAADGGSLTAEFAQMDDGFAEAVRAGRYKKVSASFWPPGHPNNPVPDSYYLRHVGFLGAHAPAVKGLRAIEFGAAEEGVIEFSEAAHGIAARLWRNMREWLIAQFGQDAADKVVPDWEIEGIKEMAARPDLPPDPVLFADPPPTPQPNPQENPMSQEDQVAALAAEKAAREKAEAEAAEAKADLKKMQDEQNQAKRDAAHKQNADFAEGLVKEGRLKPADKALVVQVLDFAEHPEHTTADFGEGEAAKPLGVALREFLAAVLPQQLPTGEMARGGEAQATGSLNFAEHADPSELELHQRAQALAAKEGISYEQAVFRCMK
ncbi:hypothetical protein [Eikenella corrodens]|uniref:2-oxoacid:acceptor oxidoreductase n=1 Tax=Eikenella corrodens CC92I TaxID=1073362 RepID=V7I8Z4_EIKCO|nr:hypothetical protein [Eikenella corrodens]ETA82665.1 hypothetical protein HMPREF1177_02136 [Eikenella corrodens CC92I]